MKHHNMQISYGDTDSITFSKQDQTTFSQKEINELVEDINRNFEEFINWEFEASFDKIIVFKAKNYILWDGKKLKTKGAALKSGTKEPALKDFMNEIVWSIINETNNYQEIYHKYIKEALNITDIKRWSSRKSVTKAVLESDRSQEANIRKAIENTEYVGGDRIHVFFRDEDNLCLVERFDGYYSKDRMLGKLFETSKVFDSVIPKGTFTNYTLKKNKKVLEELINENSTNATAV